MPKAKHTKHQLLTVVTLALTAQVAQAERMYCLCCDESQLVELKVEQCQSVPSKPKIKAYAYMEKSDLVIKGTITSAVTYHRFDGVDLESYETDLNIEEIFVYEFTKDKTCDDFQPGQSKLLHYQKLGCVLIEDKDFNDDTACFYGGHKISDLPFLVDQTLKKYHTSLQESESAKD